MGERFRYHESRNGCNISLFCSSVSRIDLIIDGTQTQTIPTKSRSRSNTAISAKSRKRPESRASTTSIHSAATHDQQNTEHHQDFQKQWYENNGHRHHGSFSGPSGQQTPDDMGMQSAPQLRNPQEFGIDPSLGPTVNHNLSFHDGLYKHENARHSLPGDVDYGTSFVEDDSPMLEGRSDEQDEVDSLAGINGTKKPSKSSAANEMEMRALFQTNKHRSLPDVASELHGNERGPQSERTRQVFAMLW